MEERKPGTFCRMILSWFVGLVLDNTIPVAVLSSGATDARNPGTKWHNVNRPTTVVSVVSAVTQNLRSVIVKYITWV